MFDSFLFPALKSRPIAKISAPDLLQLLRRVESRGLHETAHRLRQRLGQIFRYAIATGRCQYDPTAGLRGALAPVVSKRRAALTNPERVGELLRAIGGYTGQQLGVIVRQPFSSSASEALGLAITSARTGSSYRQAQQLVGDPIDKAETAVELTYRRALTPWLTIQPDLQWILSPGASRELRNALVVGLRVEMSAEWSR
mgnify:CR=1 FL=1